VAHFWSENLERSTWSSGAVRRSISCPISVWKVVWGDELSLAKRRVYVGKRQTHLEEELKEVDVVWF
jgi:hypothetical protein